MAMPVPDSVILMPAVALEVTVPPTANENVAVVGAFFALEASVTARLVRPIPGNVPTDVPSIRIGEPAVMSLEVPAAMLAKAA